MTPFQPAQAQTSIAYDDYEHLLTTYNRTTSYESSDEDALEALSGAQQGGVFDLRGVRFDGRFETTSQGVKLPAGIPGEDEEAFAEATHAMITTSDEIDEDATIYVFHRLERDAVHFLGLYTKTTQDDGEEIHSVMTYDPAESIQPIPTTTSSSWRMESTETLSLDGTPFMTADLDISYEVIGYGTLVTDFGSAEVLQVHRVERRSMFGFALVSEEYEFLGTDSLTARLVMTEDGFPGHVELDLRHGSTGTSIEAQRARLDGVSVSPNFPNPFSASTSITFEIPDTRHVSVTVFDMLGREVATLIDDVVPAGSHTAVFDAAGQPNGIYLYRVTAGDASQSGRMVLAR